MRFAIKDAGNIVFYNKATGVPSFYSEDANSFEFKLSSESVFAKAKGNKAISFDGEVNCELKLEFEVIQFAQLSVMMASDVVQQAKHNVAKSKKIVVNGEKKAILKGVSPVTGSVMAFKLDADGQEFVEKVEFTGKQNVKDYEMTITTLNVKEKDTVIVFYQEEVSKVKTVTMSTNGYSPNFRIEADVSAKNTDGKLMVLHLSIKNAKAKRQIELNFSAENPSKFTMELDCFADENGEYAVLSYLDDANNGTLQSMAEALSPELQVR